MSATDTTTDAATDPATEATTNGASDFMIEVDGQLVPNYDATIKPFEEGDVVVLQGRIEDMPHALRALGCLPLAERHIQLGRPRRAFRLRRRDDLAAVEAGVHDPAPPLPEERVGAEDAVLVQVGLDFSRAIGSPKSEVSSPRPMSQ